MSARRRRPVPAPGEGDDAGPHLARRLLTWLCGVALRLFFRRVEIVGEGSVPRRGPVIFVLNHPNGLIDPLFILALAPRRVSFLAKAPLLEAPVVGTLARTFECLPVYRAQDGADARQNRATLHAARGLLARGGAIALFPEGITHDEPDLQPLKTGAARIALGAQALLEGHGGPEMQVRVVPAGLYYSAKSTFRSDAVLVFGAPIELRHVTLDAAGQLDRDAVHALTQRMAGALRRLTVSASDSELIALAATAARLLLRRGAEQGASEAVHRRLELMQRILERHEQLQRTAPAEVDALVARLRRYREAALGQGLDGTAPDEVRVGPALRYLVGTLLVLTLCSPLVLLGVVENYLPYRLVAPWARRIAGHGSEEAVVSTTKLLAGLILFPGTWLAVTVAVGLTAGWSWAALHLVLAPPGALLSLWLLDRVEASAAGGRAMWSRIRRPASYARLRAERDALAEELIGAAGRLPEEG